MKGKRWPAWAGTSPLNVLAGCAAVVCGVRAHVYVYSTAHNTSPDRWKELRRMRHFSDFIHFSLQLLLRSTLHNRVYLEYLNLSQTNNSLLWKATRYGTRTISTIKRAHPTSTIQKHSRARPYGMSVFHLIGIYFPHPFFAVTKSSITMIFLILSR